MKISIFTFGCKTNQYETQQIREGLEKNGFEIVDDLSGDTIIINSCSVTKNAEKDAIKLIKKIKNNFPSKSVIITGCFIDGFIERIKNIKNDCYFLHQLEKNSILKLFGINSTLPDTVSYFHNHKRAFVKIQDGCNSFCSYCVVPFIRRNFVLKPISNILKEVEGLLENNYLEIVLCGIRLGKYPDLHQLLIELVSLPKDFKIRLSSIEITDIDEKVIEVISESEKMIKHLHIPLQSGSNRILQLMNRKYTKEYYLDKINFIRSKIKDVLITTDIIAGFPTEDEFSFKETLQLIQEIGFAKLHIFPYSPRPLTKANQLPQLPYEFIRDCTSKLHKLNCELQNRYAGVITETVKTNYFKCGN